MSGDEINLTLPGSRDFHGIAHLVIGGLAVRLDLTFEQLEDLQLALASVLPEHEEQEPLSVTVTVDEGAIRARIGPFPEGRLQAAIERRAEGERLDLRRLLDTVCDSFTVEEQPDGEWIELTKSVEGKAS